MYEYFISLLNSRGTIIYFTNPKMNANKNDYILKVRRAFDKWSYKEQIQEEDI